MTVDSCALETVLLTYLLTYLPVHQRLLSVTASVFCLTFIFEHSEP